MLSGSFTFGEDVARRSYATSARTKPDCETCGDTHRVELGTRTEGDGTFTGPCTACPRPCDSCTGHRPDGRATAYCATAPCACTCHRREAAIVEADRRAAWPEPEGGIAAAVVEGAEGVCSCGAGTPEEYLCSDCSRYVASLSEPTELDRANAARIIAQGRLEKLAEDASHLIASWTERVEQIESVAAAGLLRACIADLRVLFSGTAAGDDE